MKKSRKSFWAGVLSTLLVISLAAPALAAVEKTIQVSTDVQIFVDGVKIEPKDANGYLIESFISGGTTYVPLRAVSEYLGKAVKWDGDTRSVYIGEAPGQKQYLLDVCPPYQTNYLNELTTVNMAGKKYANAFKIGHDSWYGGWALFNLDGQYNTLSFDIGHIDGKNMFDATIEIHLDGQVVFSVDLTPEMLPTHYEVPLHGALQMKIVGVDYSCSYAFINAEIN